MSGVFIVDDSDLSSIDYQTPSLWFPRTISGDVVFNNTLTAGLQGARASFTYTGTAVEVIGIAGPVPGALPPAVEFSLDGVVVQTTVAPNNGTEQGQFAFLLIQDVPSGQHTVEMTVLNATSDYPFAFDTIVYRPETGASTTAGQVQTSTIFLPGPTASVDPNSNASSSSSAPVGAIVGGVVGGLAVLIAAAIAIWFFCFRRKSSAGQPFFFDKAKPSDLLADETGPTRATEPKFPDPQQQSPQSPSAVISPYSTPAPSRTGPASAYGGSAYDASASHYSSTVPSHYHPPSGFDETLSASGAGSESGMGAGSSSLGLASGSRGPPAHTSPNSRGQYSKAAEAGFLQTPPEGAEEAPPPAYSS